MRYTLKFILSWVILICMTLFFSHAALAGGDPRRPSENSIAGKQPLWK